MTNTPTYYESEKIMAVESFIGQDPDVGVINLVLLHLSKRQNKPAE